MFLECEDFVLAKPPEAKAKIRGLNLFLANVDNVNSKIIFLHAIPFHFQEDCLLPILKDS